MTSKEALNDIAVYSAFHHNVLDNSVITIKKDLEKLEKLEKAVEIIKPYLYFHTDREKISFVDYKIDTSDNKENYDLLKEVFENDK